MQLSAISRGLDLASSQQPEPEAQSNGWPGFPSRHRTTQSQTNMSVAAQSNGAGSGSTLTNGPESPISVRPYSARHSLDLNAYYDGQETPAQVSSPKHSVLSTPPKLQSSYSANDVPTMRAGANGVTNINTTPNSHAQQHLHNHNASLGRIPPNALNNRLSQDMSPTQMSPSQNGGFQSIQSALQASAPPFGPSLIQRTPQVQSPVNMSAQSPQSPYGGAYNYDYGMQMMTMGMQNMGIAQPQLYSPNNPYAYQAMQPMYSPGPVAVAPQHRDSQARVIQQRRQTDGEGMFSFSLSSYSANIGISHEPLCEHYLGISWRGDLHTLQGSAWMSIPPKEA